MIIWIYFQGRHYCYIKSLKTHPRVETATQEVFNSFFIIAAVHWLAQMLSDGLYSELPQAQPCCKRRILQFSYGLISTEQFPLQLPALNALPLLWKSSFCLSDDQDNHIFVMGICLQSLRFSYLWLVLWCIDTGVRKTSADLWRIQKDFVGQRKSVVCVE